MHNLSIQNHNSSCQEDRNAEDGVEITGKKWLTYYGKPKISRVAEEK